MSDAYAIQYSEPGKASRKDLPQEATAALLDILDALAENPDAFPERVRGINRDGTVRLYQHPSPPLEITFEVDADRRVLHLLHFVAPKVSITKPLFISYSRKDAEWLDKLKIYLGQLEKQNLIRIWDDTEIQTGQQWLPEIRKALESAQVAVFLVTQDFLASQFISSQELPVLMDAAVEKGCLIFWINVKPSTVQDSPLWKFQAANSPDRPLAVLNEGEQAQALVEVYKKLKAALKLQ